MKYKISLLSILILLIIKPVFSMTNEGVEQPGTELHVLNTVQPQADAAPVPAAPTTDVATGLSTVSQRLNIQFNMLQNISTETHGIGRLEYSLTQAENLNQSRTSGILSCVTIAAIATGFLSYYQYTTTRGLLGSLSLDIDHLNSRVIGIGNKLNSSAPTPTPTAAPHHCLNQCDALRQIENISHEGYWIPYPHANSIVFEFVNCSIPSYTPTTQVLVNMTTTGATIPMMLNITNEGIVTSLTPAPTLSTTQAPNVTLMDNATIVTHNNTEQDHVFILRMLDGFPICDQPPRLVNATDME